MSTSTEAEKLSPQSVLAIRTVGGVALVLCLLGLAFGTGSQQIGRIRDAVTDIYQRLAPREVSKEFPAIVVEIDQASLEKFGPWPWPRSRIAKLTENIFHYGAKAVGYDIVFSEPDRFSGENLLNIYGDQSEEVKQHLTQLPDQDEIFAAAVGHSNHYSVVGRAGVLQQEEGTPGKASDFPVFAEFEGDTPENLQSYPAALRNIPDIDEVAIGQGALNWEPDPDGVLRSVPLVVDVDGQLTPSFALELMRVALYHDMFNKDDNSPEPKIHLRTAQKVLRSVRLGDTEAPVQPTGAMRLHFTGPVLGRTASAVPILDRTLVPMELADKIVIIGFSGVGIQDLVPTPVHPKTPGADVHAQVIEAFYQGGWLERPHWAPPLEWVFTILLGVVAVLGLPLLSPARSVVASLLVAAGIVTVCVAAFSQAQMILDATLPLMGAGIPATITMAGILLSTERRRRELRGIVLVEEARAEEARRIQVAMLPTPGSLKDLPAAVDVWSVLEPAQSVGGDFYDAFMIDGQRLYFTIGDVTGKGVSAALFMSVVKALSKSLILRDGGELDRAVAHISSEVSRDNPEEMFATALLGVINIETGHVVMCNAGHENPIIVRANGKVDLWNMDGGPPFCVLDDFPYPVEAIQLEPGDAMIAVTDGVTEAWSPEGELFGRDRVLDAYAGLPSSMRSEGLVDHLVKEVRDFEAARRPVDDLTIMAIGYRRPRA
jgi:serine phosphatase RsbU (regulator of sigma subunit)